MIMKKPKTGIFLSLLLLVGLVSCTGQKPDSKLVINEVLTDNVSNFQDDYGVHSGWIEIFNKAYSTEDLAGCLIKVSCKPGDTATYFIPKGDVLTSIPPRQHSLFWADGAPRRGTFHTNFVLSKTGDNWIGLYDSGRNLLDEVVVPGGLLKANQSYARVTDGAEEWEVKDDSELRYVTPSTNNQTIESNPKMENFEHHDPAGVGMTVTAMGRGFGEAPGEVIAAITMALHEAQGADHDVEETILTISRVKRSYSPWSSKIYTLRETPHRK